VYIPQLEAIPPEQVPALKAIVEPSMLNDPKQYLTWVRCPVLAFFGADDVLQPTEKSAALYEQYLSAAGNKNFKIVVIPGVGHGITLDLAVYRQELSGWLKQLY
jgi:pimeloyl-ACP methyl ester carboxylesterase